MKVVEGKDKYAKSCSTGMAKFQKVDKHETFKIEGNDLKQCKDKPIYAAKGVSLQRNVKRNYALNNPFRSFRLMSSYLQKTWLGWETPQPYHSARD